MPNALTSRSIWRDSCWLLTPLLLILLVMLALQGSFTYVLDDAYIHLRLGENLGLHGHYGINPGEASAPSSSIIWPLLLAPFARLTPVYDYLPLLLNSLILLLSGWQLLSWLRQRHSRINALALAFTLYACLNLYWLAMAGMEHTLQVTLVIFLATRLVDGRHDPATFLTILLLPFIRYECLAVSLPALAWLAWQGQARRAVITGLLMCAGLASFSLFLHGQQLGWLPSSVQAKSDLYYTHGTDEFLQQLRFRFLGNLRLISAFLVVLMLLLLLAERQRRPRRALLGLALLALLLQCLCGVVGSMRYEMYLYALACVTALGLFAEPLERLLDRPWRRLLALLIPALLFQHLIRDTLLAPWAAGNIHDQQQQMAVIAKDYLRQPVAVNDLGLVSLHNPDYVLDLQGLGCHTALELRRDHPGDSRWIQALMQQHQVEYAFIYADWFPRLPDNLIRVGRLILPGRKITAGEQEVSLYASSPATAGQLADALRAYLRATPEGQRLLVLDTVLPSAPPASTPR